MLDDGFGRRDEHLGLRAADLNAKLPLARVPALAEAVSMVTGPQQ